MATKYWYVAGNGSANWSAANWYPGSGGTGGTATTLATTDDAVLDNNSGTGSLSISAAATCNSLDTNNFTGTLAGTFGLNITNNTAPPTSFFVLGSGITQNYTGTTTFGGTYNGVVYLSLGQSFKGNVVFSNANATYILDGDLRTLSTNTLTVTAGNISGMNDIYCGTFSQTGAGIKALSINNLYLTGVTPVGTITGTNFTPSINSIYITNTSVSTKTVTFNNSFGNNQLYFSGSGPMVLVPGTFFKPNVYVDNVGTAASSFNISTAGTLNSLTFQPNTAVTWSNAAIVVTVESELALTSSMAVTATPSLTFSNGGGNITLANKPLTLGTTFTVNGGSYSLTEDFNNNIAVSVLNNGYLYPKGFKTTSALTVNTGIVDIQLLSPASGSGTISTTAVDSQRYLLKTPTGEVDHFVASSNPVPTSTYLYREIYFLTGSTAAATATNLANRIANSSIGFNSTANGTTLAISSSAVGTANNGTTFSTGSITGEFPKTPLVTLGGGSATTRATGSGIIVNTAVGGQRYHIVAGNTLHAFVASGNPLPLSDKVSSLLYFFSTGSTASATAANLASKVNSIGNVGYIASSSGTTLILSASDNSGLYEDTVFLTGSLPGRKPDYSLFTLNGLRATTFSIGSLTTTDSNLYLYATENTCSGNWQANGAGSTPMYGKDIYIGGNITIPTANNWIPFYVNNLYVNGTISNTGTAIALFFYAEGINVLANTVTLTGDSGIYLANPNVVFSRLTLTNGNVFSSEYSPSTTDYYTDTLRCSGTLSLSLSVILGLNTIYAGSLTVAGTGLKYSSATSIYLTGTGSLYNPGTSTNFDIGVNSIYITDSSSNSKTLTLNSTFPNAAGSPLISLEGSGSGAYTISPSTTVTTPNIRVSNTGNANISIGTGTLSGLSFISSSNVNWNNVAGQTVTINGNLLLTSSMTTQVTPNLSLFNSTALDLAGLELKTGSFSLDTTTPFFISGNLVSNAAISITNSKVTASNYVSCSALTLGGNASLSCSNNIYIDSLTLAGNNSISAPELYVLGGSSLPTTGVPTNVTSSFTTIYYLGDSNTARTITFAGRFGAPTLYIDGDTLAGPITASLSTVYSPDVYVTNTGGSPISFVTSTLSSLSFISSSNVNWNNVTGQTVTIPGNLILTSSMTSSRIPNLILSGSNFNTLTLENKPLNVGSVTINTPNIINVSGSFLGSALVTITGSSLVVQNDFSSSTLTLGSSSISASNSISTNLILPGTLPRRLTTDVFYYYGTSSLPLSPTLNLTASFNTLHYNGNTTAARTVTYDTQFKPNPIYLGGTLAGPITASFGTATKPDVYVTNTGAAPISFLTSTLSSLTFISSSTVNWRNTGSQTLTISKSLELTSSMSTTVTPNLILSGSSFTTLVMSNEQLRTGSLTIDTPNLISVSGSLISNAPITLISSSLVVQTNFSSSVLTLVSSSISASNSINVGNLLLPGTLRKTLITDTFYYSGTGSLPFSPTLNLTSSFNTLYFDGNTNTARTITYDTQFKPSTIYIGGALSGSITASFGTSSIPAVYVDNTGRAPITFSSASISSLTFLQGARANWNTSGSQTLTISGSLTLTGSMTASRTPTLVFNGNGGITMAGKTISSSLTVQAPFTQSFLDNFSSSGSVLINGFLSASNITITRVDSLNVVGSCNINSSTTGTTTVAGTGLVWSISPTSTVNITNNVIRVVNTTNNAVTFSGGTNGIYGDLVFARGASTADNLISGSNTFVNLTDTGTAAHTMSLATNSTQTVGSFDVKGTPGNVVTVKSSTGIATLHKDPLGLVVSNYLSVNGVTATSGSGPWTWFAGPNSTLTNAVGWYTTGSEGASMVRRLGSQGVG